MTKKRISLLERVVYHEAGHAVAAYALRLPVHHATIIPNEEWKTLGYVRYKKSPTSFEPDVDVSSPHTRRRIESRVTVGMAGEAAEYILCGRYNRRWRTYPDYRNAFNIAHFLYQDFDTCAAYLEFKRLEARDFLNDRRLWRAVEVLAVALLEKKKIAGRDVRAIIKKAFRDYAKETLPPALLSFFDSLAEQGEKKAA
ncbi:MAG: hypothetical protein MSG64_20445 [Pyrinomonadaceae bacterium MAG19_C2-C3]|nr:hypothetical protein [Pyrinomonadaceae bacterium MAG19_C2-C3]